MGIIDGKSIEPLRSKLIAKSLRTAKPEGGKIDYDLDGRLVGTWFRENTRGYGGLLQEKYWRDHLSIVYNHIDPEHIIVSFGSYQGRAKQFGVLGNKPDPRRVSAQTGLVKYALVNYDYFDRDKRWDRRSWVKGLKVRNGNQVQGVVLFQVLGSEKLKVEIFPGKTASQVSGFSHSAMIYER